MLFLATWILMTDRLGKTPYLHNVIWQVILLSHMNSIFGNPQMRQHGSNISYKWILPAYLSKGISNIKWLRCPGVWFYSKFLQIYGTEFRQFMAFMVRVLHFGSTKGAQQATDHFYYISRGCATVLPAKAIHTLKNAGLNMDKPSDWVVFNQQLG